MFNKILSSIGIGAAKVDTKLANSKVQLGEELQGEVHIKGGSVDQTINQIYLNLFTTYEKEVNDTKTRVKHNLTSLSIAEQLVIQPDEERVFPFKIKVPFSSPLSVGDQQVYLSTGLDIEMAVDPKDLDPVTVLPDPIISQLFDEMKEMGFRHSYRSGICEYKRQYGSSVPFMQEFEFVPTSKFRGELDEIELMFKVDEENVNVLMQVDKKARGLMGLLEEAMDMDEKYVRFSIKRSSGVAMGELERIIRQALQSRR